jgi:hypothetical protein
MEIEHILNHLFIVVQGTRIIDSLNHLSLRLGLRVQPLNISVEDVLLQFLQLIHLELILWNSIEDLMLFIAVVELLVLFSPVDDCVELLLPYLVLLLLLPELLL